MSADRFSSDLIDEGGNQRVEMPSWGRLLVAGIVLTLAGAFLVWLFVVVIASL